MMFFRRGFTLVEILIAIVLMGLIVLAVTSVDIASRRFFGTASDESRIQDEAKIAMAHIVKNVQAGGGDATSLGVQGETMTPTHTNGYFILDASGQILSQGSRIYVRMDRNNDGRYDSADSDPFIEYMHQSADNSIWFDAVVNVGPVGGDERLAEDIVVQSIFDSIAPNEVKVTITVRKNPAVPASLDNPETTLTSSIILRAMSTN